MKKFLFLFAAAMMLLVSCNTSDAKMEALATVANAQCPMAVDEATTLTSIEYGAGTLFYNYTIDEERIPLEALDAGLEQVANNMKAALDLPQSKELVEACKNAHADVHYLYKGNQSGKSVGVTYNPSSDITTFHHLQK